MSGSSFFCVVVFGGLLEGEEGRGGGEGGRKKGGFLEGLDWANALWGFLGRSRKRMLGRRSRR